jgi:FkbM family methyltransferase
VKQQEIIEMSGSSMYYRTDSHDRSIIAEIWEKGSYAAGFPMGRKAVIIDIGAHNGYFSLYAARNSAEGSRIYAFEPVLDNFKILVENLKLNQVEKVSARNICVSGSDGTLTMYVNTAHTGGHSQYRERIEKYRPDTIEEIECDSVAFCHTVPAGVEQIDFCKIDCEGAEFDILLQAPAEFLRKVQVFAIEFHEFGGHKVEELIDLFSRHGYTVSHEFSPSKLGISFGNLLAVRNA